MWQNCITVKDWISKITIHTILKMKILPTIGPITQDTSKLKTIFKYSINYPSVPVSFISCLALLQSSIVLEERAITLEK